MQFKIRASATIEIMGEIGRPTQIQLKRLAELESKPKLTDKQQDELNTLIAKRDAKPSLSAGAKSYCKRWLKYELTGKKADISSKYTEKGIMVEPELIKMICRKMGYGDIPKNEVHFENDWATGTPDMVHACIDDAKGSWSIDTFPMFETVIPDKGYEWQVQTYMWLTGKTEAHVHYCLVDTPIGLIDYEALKISRQAGYDEVDMELFEQVRDRMTYSDLPEGIRVKTFSFTRDETMIEQIKGQVELCRLHIENELMPIYMAMDRTPPTKPNHTTLTPEELEKLNSIR